MPPKVELDDLIDVHDVAAILSLANHRAVSVYQARYPKMPRPVVDRGERRTQLWLRPEVERWARETGRLK